MAKLINVKGDVLSPLKVHENQFIVIPHCCNNLGVMGAGVALTLKKKTPSGVQPYFDAIKESENGLKNRLGEVFCGMAREDIMIANMIGQDGCGFKDGRPPVKYWALLQAMQQTHTMAGIRADGRPVVYHCPKFGSDLAGGDFRLIQLLIEETWVDRGCDVVIYEYEPDRSKWGIIE